MLKKHLWIALLFFAAALQAQTTFPRFVLAEHFTNSRCPVCASRNPAMYLLINQYAAQVHHIAYHPSVPYSTCIFYQANTAENTARTTYYGVDGTPRIVLNGALVPQGGTLLPSATLAATLNQTYPVTVEVSETASTVFVSVRSLVPLIEGNYRLFVAFVEKTVNYNAPNGETQHHDVFRDMLTDIAGKSIILAPGVTHHEFAKTTNSAWNADEMYAVAWVQNMVNKEVLNSGTRFDPVVSGVEETAVQPIRLSPNPAAELLRAELADDVPQAVEIIHLNGMKQEAPHRLTQQSVECDIAALPAGMYFLSIRGEKGIYSGKFIKE